MRNAKRLLSLFLAGLLLLSLVACGPDEPVETTGATTTGAPTEAPTTEAPTTPSTTEGATTEETTTTNSNEPEDEPLEFYLQDLEFAMKPMFTGNYMREETVLFMEYGETKELLFPIDKIVAITSYDKKTRYKEGVDFAVVDGKLQILEGSSMPCLGTENYYGVGDGTLKTLVNGEYVNTKFGNMHPWQVMVTYTHETTWDGFWQKTATDVYRPVIDKLIAGEDLTFYFYGDSITTGAEAHHYHGYHVLFTETVAKQFGYTVRYVDVKGTGISNTITNYTKEKSFGENGVITCLNSAVGGWNSQNGVDNFDVYVAPFLKQYGCDLFINAFGMNFPSAPEQNAVTHAQITVAKVKAISPQASFILVATMVPNPGATNRWYINQYKQEPLFLELAKTLNQGGTPCAVAQVTSMSQAILEIKDFYDYSGNNINHPNDFFTRVYAQVIFQLFFGYENLVDLEA